ncbi:transposase [Emticicia fluvialis]|uniref:transposase n=1 Tax=Emticicia fluvialis TaxID=2974474 RepID=UPI0021651EAF|nr:transposase [Emticicia fluvialis]
MAVRVRQNQKEAVYFVTFTCYNWIPLFEITQLYDNLYQWLNLLNRQNIRTLGYVFMPNHLHCMIYLPKDAPELYKVISNAKRFMAYEIVKRLEQANNSELLERLQNAVKAREVKKGKLHQVFNESYDAKECFNEDFIMQKLNYIHKNPLSGKWNLAADYLAYAYSSARFYNLNEKDAKVELTHYLDI